MTLQPVRRFRVDWSRQHESTGDDLSAAQLLHWEAGPDEPDLEKPAGRPALRLVTARPGLAPDALDALRADVLSRT